MIANANNHHRIRWVALLAFLTISAPHGLPAQQTTTVSDTLRDPTGLPLNGRLVITNQTTFVSGDGFEIPAGSQITVNVADGSFSVQLVPNIGATPSGTSYSVAYYLPNRRMTETWVVPRIPNATNLSNVRALTPPVPSTQLAVTQVNPPSPCTPSSFLTWAGEGWNCAQPTFSSLAGVASPSQLPSATATTAGVLQLGGDLDGSATTPQVTSTHLTAALPVSQGGTGTGASFAPGDVVFAASGGAYTQDPAFVWDAADHRLGLGTSTPQSPLHLYGAGLSGGITVDNTASAQSELDFADAGAVKFQIYRPAFSDDLGFFASGAGLGGDAMRLKYASGRLGIGTISPQQKLDVNGSGLFALNSVGFSATPAFDASLGNTQRITLAGNITSSTLVNASAGEFLYFIICQDAAGSRTFIWPANVKGGMTIGTTAGTCSAQAFVFDGNNAYALTPGVANQ